MHKNNPPKALHPHYTNQQQHHHHFEQRQPPCAMRPHVVTNDFQKNVLSVVTQNAKADRATQNARESSFQFQRSVTEPHGYGAAAAPATAYAQNHPLLLDNLVGDDCAAVGGGAYGAYQNEI